MSEIKLNSHDLLGKLTIIKNLLSVVIDKPSADNATDYLKKAYQTNQELIDLIKTIANNGQNTNR